MGAKFLPNSFSVPSFDALDYYVQTMYAHHSQHLRESPPRLADCGSLSANAQVERNGTELQLGCVRDARKYSERFVPERFLKGPPAPVA